MHFIFVACNKNKKLYHTDPSFIYRCENLAYGLQALGHTVELMHLSDFSLSKSTDVVLFHRPSYSLKFHMLILYLKYKSIFTMIDVDDLIFNPSYVEESPAVRNNILSSNKVRKQFKKNLKAFRLVSYFSVSTLPLAQHIKKIIPNCHTSILPNAVHYSWKSISIKEKKNKIKKLMYFPGTRSHDKDFALISDALSIFLNRHSDVILYITGPLEFNLDIASEQIVYNNKVPFSQHWSNYENGWINLAPLEKNHFTECKSALKVIEAGYWGIPTICSLNTDTERFINSGAVVIKSKEEWLDKLELLYDMKNYVETTKNLQNNVTKLANIKTIAQSLVSSIEKRKRFNSTALFPILVAKDRRKKGIYDCETLWNYRRAWLKSKKEKYFIEYCMFRRDLGYPLSKWRKNLIISFLSTLRGKYKNIALSLLDEVNFESKKVILNYNKISLNQEKWIDSLKNRLKNNTICIVGNSAKLHNSMLGHKIDSYELVVRFNHCLNKEGNLDIGKKLNIWVSAPGYRGEIQENLDFIIVSGPNMIYREVGWKRFDNSIKLGIPILTVPLKIWKKLVFKLNAPPSAGILILYWFKEIIGGWAGISATGFDLSMKSTVYHYSNGNYKAGERHNWEREKKLLLEWKDNGLEFLV